MGSQSTGPKHHSMQESAEEHSLGPRDAARREVEGRSVLGGTGAAWIALGLALVAAISVVASGGKYAGVVLLMETSVCVLALVVFWKSGWPRVSRITTAILAILVTIPLVQMLPLSERIVATVSPARAAIQRDVLVPIVGSAKFIPLTVNAHATRVATLLLLCYLLAFLLAFHAYNVQRRQPVLIPLLIGLGSLEAVYGIVQYLTGSYYFPVGVFRHKGDALGTYLNHNHFAGLLEMVLPFLMARVLLRLPGTANRGRQKRWAQLVSSPMTSRFLIDFVLIAVVCVALVFSRSRMGMAAAFVGLLVVLAIAISQTQRRSALAVALIFLALPAGYSIWIGLSPVWERFEMLGRPEIQDHRVQIWRDTVTLIRDYPWLGTGLGTYYWASIRYQTFLTKLRYEHAHNDYLEFAAEIGIPATLLLFGSLWVLAAKVARRTLGVERTRNRILAAGCAGAMVSLLIHSVTDYNFQIPANAFLFSWIAGTAAGLVRRSQPACQFSVPLREEAEF